MITASVPLRFSHLVRPQSALWALGRIDQFACVRFPIERLNGTDELRPPSEELADLATFEEPMLGSVSDAQLDKWIRKALSPARYSYGAVAGADDVRAVLNVERLRPILRSVRQTTPAGLWDIGARRSESNLPVFVLERWGFRIIIAGQERSPTTEPVLKPRRML